MLPVVNCLTLSKLLDYTKNNNNNNVVALTGNLDSHSNLSADASYFDGLLGLRIPGETKNSLLNQSIQLD